MAPRLTGTAAMTAKTHPRKISIRETGPPTHKDRLLIFVATIMTVQVDRRESRLGGGECTVPLRLARSTSDCIGYLGGHQQTEILEHVSIESLREW